MGIMGETPGIHQDHQGKHWESIGIMGETLGIHWDYQRKHREYNGIMGETLGIHGDHQGKHCGIFGEKWRECGIIVSLRTKSRNLGSQDLWEQRAGIWDHRIFGKKQQEFGITGFLGTVGIWDHRIFGKNGRNLRSWDLWEKRAGIWDCGILMDETVGIWDHRIFGMKQWEFGITGSLG